ncbi:MAG: hypothetical protein ABJN95_12650 [Maribacter sp.]|uniref:leucine-rich repeat domain-containing protein n=1 Tax=Maribacter sp. TaxID=1897614 RepID=UPI0032995D4B
MKKLLHAFLLSIFVISCSSDNGEPNVIDQPTIELDGKQVFRIDVKELSAKSQAVATQKKLDPAFVLLSINDASGSAILTREKIALLQDGDGYITDEITLPPATYTVVEFIVTDANDVVISIAPKEDSALAPFTTQPLPFDFVVTSDETKETLTENINAAGYTSVDFGYTGLSLTFPESTASFSLTVDETESITLKNLNLKSITGATYLVDWGDGVVEEYVSTIVDSGVENTLSHTYSANDMYTITISGAVEAIEVFEFNSNQEFDWESHITSVNFEELTLLKSIGIFTGLLTSLDISKNTELEILNVGQHQLTSIDLTNNPNINIITLADNDLTEINLSQNPNINHLYLARNQIASLDLSQNSSLQVLSARQNNLSSIDFSNNLNLTQFDLSTNLIDNIDLSLNVDLREINLGDNNLQTIDLSNNTNLVRVDLYTNQLTTLDVSANLKLRDLYVENNNLTTLDVTANLDLERLYIKNNDFSNLDISLNTKMSHLNIGENQFNETEIDQIMNLMYDQIVANAIMDGYFNYLNNPGTSAVSNATVSKINDLIVNYSWSFNNG